MNPGQGSARSCPLCIKRGVLAWGTQFAALGTSPSLLLCFGSCLSAARFSVPGQGRPEEAVGEADGVQLRGHRGGGGPVPRPLPPPPPQHHAHRRGRGVAEAHAEELVVRLLRPQPRARRRPQVRLRAGHARWVVQVPPPPQQLPRPPGVPSFPGRRHHLRRAAARRATAVLPHRRGAVTAPPVSHLNQESPPRPGTKRRGGRKRKEHGLCCYVTQERELICSSLHLDAIGKKKSRLLL